LELWFLFNEVANRQKLATGIENNSPKSRRFANPQAIYATHWLLRLGCCLLAGVGWPLSIVYWLLYIVYWLFATARRSATVTAQPLGKSPLSHALQASAFVLLINAMGRRAAAVGPTEIHESAHPTPDRTEPQLLPSNGRVLTAGTGALSSLPSKSHSENLTQKTKGHFMKCDETSKQMQATACKLP
jgi:hypothetical protein